jgi:Transcriptional regulator
MNQLEEAVLLATIDEGGNNPVQKFSTIHIAAACGVSEFLIYEHFVSRQKLLVEADDYVAQHFRAQVLALTEKHLPYPELFSALLDYQLAHPSWNGFSLNYGHFFPRYGLDKAEEEHFHELVLETGRRLFQAYQFNLDDFGAYQVFCFFLRELFSFAQLLISKEIIDTPATRLNQANLVLLGMGQFWKSPAKAA